MTIRQVATRAGVSVTTVSHAFSGRGRVDPGTRERVVAAAEALGYRPNRSAQSLRLGKTRTLALLLPAAPSGEDTNVLLAADFYVTLANVAARAAFDHDYALMLLPPLEVRPGVAAPAIDGAIVVDPVRNDGRLQALHAAGVPTVTIERDPGHPEDPWWVAPDNPGNARMVLDHLAASGASRVALLSVDVDAGWAVENEEAYRAWCAERRQRPIVERASLAHLVESTEQAVHRLLRRARRPDGLFVLAELFGPRALTSAQAAGVRIPGELLIAAGHDSRAAQLSHPGLTAVNTSPESQAGAAVELLLARLAGEQPSHRTIPGRLQARGSTGDRSRPAG